jgi:acetyltransferase-like isoleucine patch superfamily enzyme
MQIANVFRRFFVPSSLITVIGMIKFGCKISPRAEVEISPNLKIGRGTNISSFTKIKSSYGLIHIGGNVSIAAGCDISTGENGVIIGDDCLIGPHVVIVGNNYRYEKIDVPIRSQGMTSKGIVIGNNVWIGAGCCILDGSKIGDGVIISPNSVVSSRVPDNAIVQGNPAKVIFQRR